MGENDNNNKNKNNNKNEKNNKNNKNKNKNEKKRDKQTENKKKNRKDIENLEKPANVNKRKQKKRNKREKPKRDEDDDDKNKNLLKSLENLKKKIDELEKKRNDRKTKEGDNPEYNPEEHKTETSNKEDTERQNERENIDFVINERKENNRIILPFKGVRLPPIEKFKQQQEKKKEQERKLEQERKREQERNTEQERKKEQERNNSIITKKTCDDLILYNLNSLNNKKSDINENEKEFTMKLNLLLEKMKQEREENQKKLNVVDSKYKNFLSDLDKINDNLNLLQTRMITNETKRYENKGVSTDDNPENQKNNERYLKENGETKQNDPNEDKKKKERDELFSSLNLIDNSYKSNYSSNSLTGWNNKLNLTSGDLNSNPDLDSDLKRNQNLLKPDNSLLRSGLFEKYNIPYPPSPQRTPQIKKEKVDIDVEIDNIADLIKLAEDYPLKFDVEYNINMQGIHNIKEPLKELNSMIGLNSLKERVVDQILYYIQDLHKVKSVRGDDFMHTVIYGPPGTGKTEAAKLMGRIFSKLGILRRGSFRKVVRSDLIAGYLGQTALKTRDVIKESLGGVLFIDEAYALGNDEKRDSFAKECIDTLCECLSDNKDNLMVIIAGYEKELKECFFNYNPGLESRFTWRFETDDYNAKELRGIFEKKVKDAGWEVKEGEVKDKWFEDNMSSFKYYGRDMETLFSKVKIAHSRRVFCKPKEEKTKIILKDLEKGLKVYLDNGGDDEEEKEKKKFENELRGRMYM